MTEYVVFQMYEGRWEECARPLARSAKAAIRHYLGEDGSDNGEQYAAVPARSWKPVTVKVETKTALRYS